MAVTVPALVERCPAEALSDSGHLHEDGGCVALGGFGCLPARPWSSLLWLAHLAQIQHACPQNQAFLNHLLTHRKASHADI